MSVNGLSENAAAAAAAFEEEVCMGRYKLVRFDMNGRRIITNDDIYDELVAIRMLLGEFVEMHRQKKGEVG